MDFRKLSQSNMIAGGGGIVAFIASILPWYSFDFGFDLPGVDTSINAWSAGFAAWFGCLLALAAGVLIALKAMGMFEAKVLGMETEQVAMLLAGLGFVLVVLRWLTETSNTAIGLYLGLIATAATAAGPSCRARIPVSAFLQLTTSRALVATMLPAAARLPSNTSTF